MREPGRGERGGLEWGVFDGGFFGKCGPRNPSLLKKTQNLGAVKSKLVTE